MHAGKPSAESDVFTGTQNPICNRVVCVDWVLQSVQFCVDWALQSVQFCVDWALQSVQFCVDWVLQSVQFCVRLYGCCGYSCLPGWPELLFVGVKVTGQVCLKKTFSSSGFDIVNNTLFTFIV